jgi:hypothetical protein
MTRQEEILQLCKDIACLWRPEDRLLFYVEARLERLAVLGATPPWALGQAEHQARERRHGE